MYLADTAAHSRHGYYDPTVENTHHTQLEHASLKLLSETVSPFLGTQPSIGGRWHRLT